MNNENYKSVRVKSETYKELKILAVQAGLPFTKFIEMLLEMYKKHKESE